MHIQAPTRTEMTDRAITLADGRKLPHDRPLVMGILNVTPDSFSDGGRWDTVDKAVEHSLKMVDEGADTIDIGGESTRPGSDPTPVSEEQDRVIPVIEAIRAKSRIPISIDTYNSATARVALGAGADIVNDISALRFDSEMAPLIAERNVPIVLMHMLGKPKDMQKAPKYDDCVREIAEFFDHRISYAAKQGIDRSNIVIDPGIGFGKRLSDNLDILARLGEFTRLGVPVMVGASRKSFIEMLNPVDSSPDDRLGGSIAAMLVAVSNGANIVRVHDVGQTVTALKLLVETRERR
jgi:dihydropteroate synthase